MSYIFYPPRTDNFYPSGPPYLAGLRGLGDYAADLAAYNADIAKWRLESIAANRAKLAYDAQVKAVDDSYASALAAYKKDKMAWDREHAAYTVAMAAWQANNRANTAKSQQIAATYGLNLTQGYYLSGACLSQAQRDEYARNCTTVKGIGGYLRGLGSQDPDCGMKLLPICTPAPTLRNQPQPPVKGAYPTKPKALRPMPIAPTEPATTPTTPSSVPTVSDETPHADTKQANVLMGGLIVAAVAVGGYLVYRTLKKPKAQAA